MAGDEDFTDAEIERIDAASRGAAAIEKRRIREERALGSKIHRVAHEREAIDPDDKGKPTGWRDRILACPDCHRSLEGAQDDDGRPVRICPQLAGLIRRRALPLPRGRDHDVLACGTID